MNSFIEAANKAEQQTVIDRETKELVKVYSQADLEKQKSISVQLRRDLFSHDSPRNAEELYKYLDVVHGLRLGVTVSDEKWTAPFEWAYAMYFDKYPSILTIAPRSSGKTVTAGSILYDKCAHRAGYQAVHLGALMDQANVMQVYLNNFSQDPSLNQGLNRKGVGKREARWDATNSWFRIASGTMAGVSGLHPNQLSLDELEFADEQMVEQSFAVPIEKNGWPRLWAGFSTRQRACLPGHMRIITESGPKTIKDIVKQKYNGKVRSFNFETNEFEWNEVIGWHENGRTDEWFHVKLEVPNFGAGGAALMCTKEHELLRYDGSKTPLKDLNVGDEVCIEDVYFTEDQWAILYGTYMGDGCIQQSHGFCFGHSRDQLDYLTWQREAFGELATPVTRASRTTQEFYEFLIGSNSYFHRWREQNYTVEDGKGIPDWIWDYLDNPLALACWFMDDGGYAPSINKTKENTGVWSISAMHFREHEREACSQFFENLGYPGRWFQSPTKYNPDKNWVFTFNTEVSGRLTELLSPWIDVTKHKGYGKGWKTWVAKPLVAPAPKTVLTPLKIKDISPATIKDGRKFDITVDRVHNYQVYSGLLVGNSGTMNKLTQAAESGTKKIKLFQWSIFESMEACVTCRALDKHPHGGSPGVEEARHEACPLWKWCRGELNRKSTGWMKLDQVIDTVATMNEASIETQILCLRPSTHGVVLHNFRHEHATATERSKGNYFAWTHQKDMPFYVWIDPAETKKGCALFVQIHNGRIFAFDEIVDDSGPTTEDLKEAVHKKCREGGYGEPKRVVLDPRRTDTKKIWVSGTLEGIGKDHCFNAAFPNIKNGMDDIEAGLDLVRTYILNGVGERRFFVNPIACPKHVEAITNNMYKVDKNNQIHQNTKQNEKWKDEIDTIRYGIIDAHRSGGGASV